MLRRQPFLRVSGPWGLCLLLLVVLIVPAAPTLGADPLPLSTLREKGHLGAAAADYLVAFNADDADLLEGFMSGYRDAESLARTPVAVRVQRQKQFRGMLGELTLYAIVRNEVAALDILVHAAQSNAYLQFSFEAASFDPLKISSMGMRPALPPEDGDSGLESAETLAALVESALATYEMPALALAVGPRTGAVQAVVKGVRNVSTGEPVAEEDLFHLGSLTKSMTASVAARLVDRGELDWAETLGDCCSFPLNPAFGDVTLAQLLQHRGGLDPLLDMSAQEEAFWRASAADPPGQRLALLREVLARTPLFAPGRGFAYSNAGYTAAAALMEHLDGRPWETLVDAEVFGPLGLQSAGLGWPATAERPGQPRGHWAEADTLRLQEFTGYDLDGMLAPAGDVHMSIADLARYGQAHLQALAGESPWLTHEAASRLHTSPEGDGAADYAMGWALEDINGRPSHMHAGSAGTFYAFLCLFPADDLVVAIAMNDGKMGNDAVAREMMRHVRRIFGKSGE